MTEPVTPNQTPAGWYPNAGGASSLRYWNGTAWTEHTHQTPVAGYAAPQIPKAPEGTSFSTPWGWVVGATPAFSLVQIYPMIEWIKGFGAIRIDEPATLFAAEFNGWYGVIAGVGLVFFGLMVLFAALDQRQLAAQGVPRPFHWAWSFLGIIVYIIGRTVVLRRRGGRAMGPMWLFIATYAVSLVVTSIVTISLVLTLAAGFSHQIDIPFTTVQ